MLGFALHAVNAFEVNHLLIGSCLFVAALCYKQMALYYSPAVFFYLLRKCIYPKLDLLLLLKLAIIVIISFGAMLAPLVTSVESILQVLRRVFPFTRGLYEDKVANVWCALNTVLKLRQLLSLSQLQQLRYLFEFYLRI